MQASRLLSILMLLQAKGRLTAGALAKELEVSERTILRDIDSLSAAGVPLWGERGRQGGFQLREGWSTQLTGMTQPEAGALLLAGLPGPATELGLGTAAASARLKLLASLPAPFREQADRVSERLHIDPVDWYRAPDAPKYLREVAQAVWNGQRLAAQYESWNGLVQRQLEPLGLVLKAGAWYLLARSVDKPAAQGNGAASVRTYRVAGLRSVQQVAGKVTRPRGFELARHWQAGVARFEADLRPLKATVRLSARAAKWLNNERQQALVSPQPVPGPQGQPGWHEAVMALESVEQGARQLLKFGAELQVLGPKALRTEVLKQARGVVALYAPASPRSTRAR